MPLGGWTTSAYLLACTTPVKSLADLKGKRVRATGGNAEMFKMAGAVPVGATLVEAVSLLQRGGLDCQHGIADWLRTFGYADFAKYVIDYPLGLTGPAIGIFMNRDTWNKLHARAEEDAPQAGGLAERQDGDRQLHRRQRGGARHRHQGQGRADGQGRRRLRLRSSPNIKKAQRDTNVETGKSFGVKDPGAIIDAYEQAVEKWRTISKQIGRDIDKFTDVLDREIFSKVDPDKL